LVQVSRIELGKTNPKLSTIYAIARALEVSPKEFF
jgi:transcriptional regulator with XRE-family HTH domain